MKFGHRMKNYLVMVSLLVIVQSTEANEKCKSMKFLWKEEGHYLRHHSVKNLTDVTDQWCRMQCYMHTSCMSLNYLTRSATCEINDADRYSHPEDFVRKAGSVYVGTDNACISNPCPGNATCQPNFNTQSYSCFCPLGFGGPYCTDIDECASDSNNCSINHTCINTSGSYNCSCKPGYEEQGIKCIDIDECASDSNNCSINHTCINAAGTYNCSCKPGYQEQGITCIDIDECASDSNNCSSNHNCINTAGSYDCICKPGYEAQGMMCIDIDECKTNAHDCAADQTCANIEGSFECRCNDGYKMFENNCKKIDADYVITVYTSDVDGGGTDANVFIQLHGSQFKKNINSSKVQLLGDFERGSVQQMTFNAGELPNMESLSKITMSHDNAGSHPLWYLAKVIVDNKTRRMKYTFRCQTCLLGGPLPLTKDIFVNQAESY